MMKILLPILSLMFMFSGSMLTQADEGHRSVMKDAAGAYSGYQRNIHQERAEMRGDLRANNHNFKSDMKSIRHDSDMTNAEKRMSVKDSYLDRRSERKDIRGDFRVDKHEARQNAMRSFNSNHSNVTRKMVKKKVKNHPKAARKIKQHIKRAHKGR